MTFAAEAEGVSVRFGAVDALRDVTFAAPAGAFVAVIGPNGAGKSTLLHILLGLTKADSGAVRLLGAPPDRAPASAIGYVPQIKTLDRTFPARAIDLVATGILARWPWRIGARDRAACLAAMERTRTAQLAARPLAALSGGELQRVYLARALARTPQLLILDEPAAGMDMAGEADMYHILADYQKESGATVIMITHDWEGARYHATHVALMDRGTLRFGSPEDIAAEDRLLKVFGYVGHGATHGGHSHA